MDKVSFSLRGITTEQFALLPENYSAGGTVQFGIDIGFGYNAEQKMVAPFFKCAFLQNDRRFIILEVACHFEIEQEAWQSMYHENEKRLVVPAGLARHLAMITVGTARGILHAKTEKTEFNKYLIPTVNLEELIVEDPVLEEATIS